jgi:hypothetical protein
MGLGAGSYSNLLRELMEIELSGDAKRQIMQVLRRNAERDGVKALDRCARVDYARHLLSLKVDRPSICARLMDRFDIAEATAYRDIDKAL